MSSQAVPAWSRILPPGPAQPQADPRQRYRITPDAALWCHRQSGTPSRCAGRIGEESLNLTEMSMRMRPRGERQPPSVRRLEVWYPVEITSLLHELLPISRSVP